jgi:hypothetical protein
MAVVDAIAAGIRSNQQRVVPIGVEQSGQRMRFVVIVKNTPASSRKPLSRRNLSTLKISSTRAVL